MNDSPSNSGLDLDSDSNCIFCKIVKKEMQTKIIYENDDFIAFNDIKPVSPTHILVIPKKHYKNLFEANDKDMLGKLLLAVKEVATEKGLGEGFRTVINTGDNGGQTVHHIHAHVLGGRFHKWPPG
ncbi:MAG: histidine triad nucleotide-binding protein [Candidatus Melainabacteria bacterium RIFCSPHIGHO2_02_FULL_34_12]|nr:MAG: histidine triad nucleotide-binding protein [Candidatus Melainabacteria bacterium RIFCSPHIGHO2_02_FULL_34_12]